MFALDTDRSLAGRYLDCITSNVSPTFSESVSGKVLCRETSFGEGSSVDPASQDRPASTDIFVIFKLHLVADVLDYCAV